jgi:plastocyanin
MLNRLSNDISMKLSLLLFIISISVATFAAGENAFRSVFPLVLASGSSPVAVIITITDDAQQNTLFRPETTTVSQGAEIFIGNNSSSPHSITSGTGPEDPLSGKLFDTGVIKSKGYGEFVTANLNPGTYPYYSSTNPSVKGTIIIQK